MEWRRGGGGGGAGEMGEKDGGMEEEHGREGGGARDGGMEEEAALRRTLWPNGRRVCWRGGAGGRRHAPDGPSCRGSRSGRWRRCWCRGRWALGEGSERALGPAGTLACWWPGFARATEDKLQSHRQSTASRATRDRPPGRTTTMMAAHGSCGSPMSARSRLLPPCLPQICARCTRSHATGPTFSPTQGDEHTGPCTHAPVALAATTRTKGSSIHWEK